MAILYAVSEMPKRPFLSDDDEWPDESGPPSRREKGEESNFVRTGDYAYVALAIAVWMRQRDFPDDPPQWAVDACLALYEKIEFKTAHPPPMPV